MLAFAVLAIIGLWKTLTKAGLPGWAAIIPFYNEYNVVKLSNRPVYFFWIILGCSLLAWIPFIGLLLIIGIFVLWIFIALDIAANFGQGTGFAILLILFPSIMFLFLGFGSYEFRRIAAPGSAGFGAPPMPAGGGYVAAPPAPPAGQQFVPPTPGPAAQPMTPPPPLVQPLQPPPLSPPPAQAAPYTPPPQATPYATPPAESATPTPPPGQAAPYTPPPAQAAPPESPTPPPPPPPPVT
ncbi:MAG: DUF5684 domain-containing protein [Actinobacteria bacterium]|nr:DUF5684 domain-containing protein [Actinomycetota bacterium]